MKHQKNKKSKKINVDDCNTMKSKHLEVQEDNINIANNEEEDKDIIASSQSINESKLRKQIKQKFLQKSNSPKKSQNTFSPNKILISDNIDYINDAAQTELSDMLGNLSQIDPIEMTHDLNSLIVNSKLNTQNENSLTIDDGCTTGTSTPRKKNSIRNEISPVNVKNGVSKSKTTEKIIKRKRTANLSKKLNKMQAKLNLTDSKLSFSVIKNDQPGKKPNGEFTENEDKGDGNDVVNEEIPKDLQKKMKSLKIMLKHEVPPQHKVEKYAGIRNLSPKERDIFLTYGPLKLGAFSKDEDEIIKRNWQDFCDVHNWDSNVLSPFLKMRFKGIYYLKKVEDRKNFVRILAKDLPWRSLYSVYFRFRNIYNIPSKKGKYSSREDKIILKHLTNNDSFNISNQIAEKLKRKKKSVYQRIKKLKTDNHSDSDSDSDNNSDSNNGVEIKKGSNRIKSLNEKKISDTEEISETGKIAHDDSRKTENINFEVEELCNKKLKKPTKRKIIKKGDQIHWNTELVKEFLHTLEKFSSKNMSELKNQIFDAQIWKQMEVTMRINKEILYNFWYLQLHMQLFCSDVIYLNDIKVKLITWLYEKNISCYEDINWLEVNLKIEGLNSIFLSKLFDNLVEYAKKNTVSSNIEDILAYLYCNHIPELINKSVDAVLPKLYYKSNSIICLNRGTENKITFKKSHDPFMVTKLEIID